MINICLFICLAASVTPILVILLPKGTDKSEEINKYQISVNLLFFLLSSSKFKNYFKRKFTTNKIIKTLNSK